MKALSDEGELVIKEIYGNNLKERLYVKPPDQNKIVMLEKSLKFNIQRWLTKVFLPQGYPDSVTKDYMPYQIWDTAQAFCSTIAGILATQQILRGVGVGDQNASPLAATITWVIKDGCGHLGRIIFAYSHGSYLDAYSKKWRLYADVLNDAAMCIEMILPYFKNYTTFILCTSTSMKAVVGVAGGATRAAMTQHHALRGNMADVSAKDSAQETGVNLVASFVALLMVNYLRSSVIIFSLMIILHIVFNYLAVRAVCLRTLNEPRFELILTNYLKKDEVLNPYEINRTEPIFYRKSKKPDNQFSGFRIYMGYSINIIIKRYPSYSHLCKMNELFKSRAYLLYPNTDDREMYVLLKEEATSDDILCSYFTAVLLSIIICDLNDIPLDIHMSNKFQSSFLQICHMLKSVDWSRKKKAKTGNCGLLYNPSYELFKYVDDIAYTEWHKVLSRSLIETGWDLKNNLLICDEWRITRSMENKTTKRPNSPIKQKSKSYLEIKNSDETTHRSFAMFTIEPNKAKTMESLSFKKS